MNRHQIAAILLTILLPGCDKPDNGDGSGTDSNNGQIEGNVTVTVTPERSKNLRNPLCGWMLYSGLGNGLSETFWEDYDALQSSEGKVKVSDYANILLIRAVWSQLNPEEGVYVWQESCNTKPAQRFRYLVNGAKERGMKLAFGFSVDSRDKHENSTPDWVRLKPGIKGFSSTTGSVQVWSPYPDCPVFQECYEKFIKDFAAEMDNHEVVDVIEGVGLGKWGEYHSCLYSTGNMQPREPVFDWACDLFMKYFKEVPVHMNYHRWIGTGTEWNGSSYDHDSERLVNKAISKGFILGSGAFGMKTYYSTWEKNFVASHRYEVPVTCEGGWVKSSHGNSIKNDGYADYAAVRRGEFDDARHACANTMDLRYNSNVSVGETYSWFNDAFDLVKQFIADGAYRLYPDRLSLPETASVGEEVTITHRWSNLGYAYCPTNINAWKDIYKVAFALLDPQTDEPVALYIDENAHPHDWIKSRPVSYTFKTRLTGLRPGSYTWAVGIIDVKCDNKIGIQISAKKNIAENGWLKLCDITVQ